jgi:hypothetical protein
LNQQLYLDENEIPTDEMAEYILVPAESMAASQKSSGVTVFCIDVSGSMGVTTAVPELQGTATDTNTCALRCCVGNLF